MKHSKIMLVGCISAIVAITTAFLGVTGTIIGSVFSSVLYNVLSEYFSEPLEKSSFDKKFEWDLAYLFPLIVIALIQFLLIFAFLAEWSLVPYSFLNIYLNIQHAVDNNLYRILGISLLFMSIYPFVLKPDAIKKKHGLLIAFVALIFLARGFVNADNAIVSLYYKIFIYFDFPIAILAFIIIIYTIFKIFFSVKEVKNSKNIIKTYRNQSFKDSASNDLKLKKISSKKKNISYKKSSNNKTNQLKNQAQDDSKINTSSDDIEFVSNNILKNYKKK